MQYQTKLTDYVLYFDNRKLKITKEQIDKEAEKLESLRRAVKKSLEISPESWNMVIRVGHPYNESEMASIYR